MWAGGMSHYLLLSHSIVLHSARLEKLSLRKVYLPIFSILQYVGLFKWLPEVLVGRDAWICLSQLHVWGCLIASTATGRAMALNSWAVKTSKCGVSTASLNSISTLHNSPCEEMFLNVHPNNSWLMLFVTLFATTRKSLALSVLLVPFKWYRL